MSKKKPRLYELEDEIGKVIQTSPCLKGLSELEYCAITLEALDLIREGLEMRKQELEEESGQDE